MEGRLKAIARGVKFGAKPNRAKNDFLANMSHELRTPMTVIMGSLDLLRHAAPAPEERELVEMAATSADLLLGIIDDLLDISRIEAGRLKIEARPFALRDCVAQAVAMFAKQAAEKGLRLRWEVAPQIPAQVHGDPDRLRQVLINLINAVKFTATGEVTVTLTRAGEELYFAVRDTGIGIPAEKIGQLFRPFTQVDSSLTRQYGGTGLGLAISKELLALMGGTIRLASEAGRGSTVTFTLPLRPAAALAVVPPPDRAPVRAAGTLRILLVEDDPQVRELVKLALERRGVTVSLAENGRQAIANWQEGGVDLILMDLQMPELDGLEAVRPIRALEGAGGHRASIVALTAHVRAEDRDRCQAAGMDGFLAKPLRSQELDALLAKHPGRGRH